ncbi:RNA polymerase sigma-70 factor [Fimbriimonas ginsengisoli Gsoil 348]|uniref:RNA polymerase sigma-70 factor n=2 Tax=Fimbriimonas ginsengisoli TaxID=1005039 RepID=A0A068NNR7_FIMGI|nr:RNA polymerase sigma-70 factor [Fimbriimonas ginsengisoli Gsoil 348]
MRALGNVDDAYDVAQETLAYAVVKLPTLRDHTKFTAWLRQLTLTHCTDYRRRRGTRRLGEPIAQLNEASEEADLTQRLAIRDSLKLLSEPHQDALLMYYVGGWSIPEIAHLLEVPPNTVRSRLMAAKRLIRDDLQTVFPYLNPMKLANPTLSESHMSLIEAAFPGSRIVSVQADPEPWQPFSPRVKLALSDGTQRTVDFRRIDAHRIQLAQALARLGIPGPQVIAGPQPGQSLCLCQVPRGENLSLWALGGTPHRIRLATERAIEGLDRLQACSEGLMDDPIGATLPRRTLLDEVAILTDDERWNADPWLAEAGAERRAWLADPWFADAVARVGAAVVEIDTPLVYTDYMFFFPQGYRIQTGTAPMDDLVGWPGDPHYGENPLVEFVHVFGHFGDPLLGLAMVWVYDCYPFVHTGFVEQVLWRRGVTQREFAPRLALKALQMIARDLPLERPAGEARYWQSLRGWAEQALSWM